MSKNEAKRRRREKIEDTKEMFRTHYGDFLKASSSSPSVLAGIPFLILTSSEPDVPKDYKRILEAETISRLMSCLMDEENPQAMILSLTQGSILNDVFREFFDWADRSVGQPEYRMLYRSSLDALDETIRSKIHSLDETYAELNSYEEMTDFEICSDDLPF